jgi:hypothetical protein
VPFLVGLLLTPVAALIGTLTVVAFIVLVGGRPDIGMMPTLLMVGLLDGSLHAAPVTMLALPVTYAILKRRSALKIWRLALAGGGAGIASILLFTVVLESARTGQIETGFFTGLAFQALAAMTAVGSFAGAVMGTCFACVMRWLRPEPWRAPQISPEP